MLLAARCTTRERHTHALTYSGVRPSYNQSIHQNPLTNKDTASQIDTSTQEFTSQHHHTVSSKPCVVKQRMLGVRRANRASLILRVSSLNICTLFPKAQEAAEENHLLRCTFVLRTHYSLALPPPKAARQGQANVIIPVRYAEPSSTHSLSSSTHRPQG